MDVILAVALGGNPLGGGKFNITASIIGAYVIQMLTTTLQKYDVKSTEIPAYKAVVVIILVVVSAPVVRQKMTELKNKLMPAKAAKEPAEIMTNEELYLTGQHIEQYVLRRTMH